MFVKVLAVLVILPVIVQRTYCENSHVCSAPKSASMGIYVRSIRNETGHWIAQMNFTHDSEKKKEGESATGPWNVYFNQTVNVYEKGESVLIVATLASIPVCNHKIKENRDAHAIGNETGYELVPGLGSYKLHINPKTWDDARKICQNEKAHLAIINSEAEAKALLSIWQKYTKLTNYFVFLGFNDIRGEGKYKTVKGNPLEDTGFTNWEKGQPDDTRAENCGGLNRSGRLHDLSCTTKIPYFCEQPLKKPAGTLEKAKERDVPGPTIPEAS